MTCFEREVALVYLAGAVEDYARNIAPLIEPTKLATFGAYGVSLVPAPR